MSNNYRKRAPG